MKTALLIGMVGLLAACAGVTPRAQNVDEPQGRWQGYILRNGLRQPMGLELTEASSVWDGRFSAGDNAVRIESVRVSGNNVHFELPGEGAFDGAVAGNKMEGSVSGAANGSFNLTRIEPWTPYPFGP